MKTIAAILVLLAFCRLGPAQTKNENQLSPRVRIYQPKNLSVQRANQVANFVQSVIGSSGSGCQVGWSDVPHAIVIRSQDPSDLDAAEALLKRFDVPEPEPQRTAAPWPDCTVYLIRASSSTAVSQTRPVTVAGPGGRGIVERRAAETPTTPVPAELQSAIDEMKRTFGYDRYALWDAIVLQPTGGEGEVQGILPTEGANPYVYSMSYTSTGVTEARNLILRGFQFSVKMPANYFNSAAKDGIESRIRTDVTIREGQKLVLGKIRLMPYENADLFLVLATKAR